MKRIDIITGDAMLAPNPWQSTQNRLMAVDGYTPDQALREISHFLLQWPGTQTANAELAVRHARGSNCT